MACRLSLVMCATFCCLICRSMSYYSQNTTQEVQAEVGGRVRLPCNHRIQGNVTLIYMQRTHPLAFVNGYHHRNDVKQDKMFINRTVLGPSMAWVDLLDVRVNDEGVYHCVLVDGTTITKTLTLYLKVRANYSAPVVTVTHSNKSVCGGSCLVTCSSSGGYPNTNVTWTFQPQTAGTQGMELSRISEQNNVTGLYTVSSSIFINCSQLLNITCTVGGVVSQQEEICNISANDSFDWVVITATAVTATMFTLVLVILVKRLKACPTTDPQMKKPE